MTTRINLWSTPRNISTAIMYAFAQRPDTRVVDEPLYAHYLSHAPDVPDHPGTEAILASQATDGQLVVQEVLHGAYDRPVVVFKQMTHHLIELPFDFLKTMKNVLLIRDPRRIIASFAKVIPDPQMRDIGVQLQWELAQYIDRHEALHAVIDTRELLQAPRQVLQILCRQLDIPFFESMLSWEAGARPEDGVWAPYWYANVHRSTGFQAYEEKPVQLSPKLEGLAASCQPFYQELL
ncbi:MAG: hypothetical protein KDC44_19210, partial [Phaeodactylibacter sp.]|nr:hypothetical protein [Phaeodactylibacter sp.]